MKSLIRKKKKYFWALIMKHFSAISANSCLVPALRYHFKHQDFSHDIRFAESYVK